MQQDRRALFNRVALGCISYLESSEECRSVIFHSPDGAGTHEFASWEKKNSPLKLPEDLKKFYSLFNGFSVTWAVEITSKAVNIGDIRLNRIDQVQRNNSEFYVNSSTIPKDVDIPDFTTCTLYTIDSNCEVGEIVLLYRCFITDSGGGSNNISINTCQAPEKLIPEIWLFDNSGQLHFICSTFTQYLRLMVAHLGIYGWQLAFTETGMSELTQQWMNVFCKERLIIDRHYAIVPSLQR